MISILKKEKKLDFAVLFKSERKGEIRGTKSFLKDFKKELEIIQIHELK